MPDNMFDDLPNRLLAKHPTADGNLELVNPDGPEALDEIEHLQAKLKTCCRAAEGIGPWLSAALDDVTVCTAMKRDIMVWMEAMEMNEEE